MGTGERYGCHGAERKPACGSRPSLGHMPPVVPPARRVRGAPRVARGLLYGPADRSQSRSRRREDDTMSAPCTISRTAVLVLCLVHLAAIGSPVAAAPPDPLDDGNG